MIKTDVHILYSIDRVVRAREMCIVEFKKFMVGFGESDIEDHLYTCSERVFYYRSRKEKLQYQIQGYKIRKVMDKKVSKNVFELTKF